MTSSTLELLEDQLNSFDLSVRKDALCELSKGIESGSIIVPAAKKEVNLHFHTFFYYNAYGWSPSRIAWEARKYGLEAAGIVDFDVLDGMEEFLNAGEIINLRATAALETRVFINEYADTVINSPNEPGISYFMAGGCYQLPANNSKSANILQSMRDMAKTRNDQVMQRVNDYLVDVQIGFDSDLQPITPSGNATERHMLAAYDAKARQVFNNDIASLAAFWSKALSISTDEAEKFLSDTPSFHEKMRAKLMKYGGVGYVPPTTETFPSVDLVIEMIEGMQALPIATWLDGTNSGESDMPSMLELLASKGVVALNIVPDRNWNIKNPDEKEIKIDNLADVVEAAREIDFPLCVGTELNKIGLPFVDDFSAPELQPYIEDFINGAYFFWGHTFLARNAGIGYASDWSKSFFGDNRAKKNSFYTEVGKLADPIYAKNKIANIDFKSLSPDEVLRLF